MNITVGLRDEPYDVVIGAGVRHEMARYVQEHLGRAHTLVVITSPEIRSQSWFDVEFPLDTLVVEVPDGEEAKSLASVEAVCERLARHAVSRHDVIIGVGGGAITDLAGFVAAVYLRGIAVLQMPTSIVGQVDAAIGGKTAVNIPAGKNLVGAFHQPARVFCDTDVLATLKAREYTAGMGEVAKCWLLEGRNRAALDDATLAEFIEMSVALKARLVAADEFERTGERALLNYGHTLGHALESLALAVDVDELRHGEAVAVGLAFAVRLARALGRVDEERVHETDAVLDFFGLPRRIVGAFEVDDLLATMARDKKAHHNLTFVLDGPQGFGVVSDVEVDVVRDVLTQFMEA
jgi:5-deoxy-5-amino-3-dehydroquinate synthase